MTTDKKLAKRLAELEKSSAKAQKRFAKLEQDSAKKDQVIADLNRLLVTATAASGGDDEVVLLKAQLAELVSEKATLAQTVDQLKADRVKPTPTQLLGSFRNAMDELRTGLTPAPGDRVAYTVSQFDVDLKAQVAVDEASESIRFILPEPGQTLPADTLSQIRFTFQSVPLPQADEEEPFIAVPTLLQLSRETALLALQQAGLSLGTETARPSHALPGTVIAQIPDPGDEIPASETVDIVVAQSITVTMPNVTGLTIKDAYATLAAHDLVVGELNEERVDDIDAGTVIKQSIAEGEEVARGTSIDLTVTRTEKIDTPRLIGMKLARAKKVLAETGLVLGRIETQTAAPDQDGLILSQNPEADTPVPAETAVDIVVGSVGRGTVPNVRGRNLTQASKLLEEYGFSVGKITRQARPGAANIVLSQTPAPHAQAPLGTAVDLVLSKRFTGRREIVERVLAHPRITKVGVERDKLRERIATTLADEDKTDKLLENSDAAIKKELAIPQLKGVRELTKIIRETLKKGE